MPHGLLDILSGVEGADADKALAAFPETGAGRAHDTGLFQQQIEKFP